MLSNLLNGTETEEYLKEIVHDLKQPIQAVKFSVALIKAYIQQGDTERVELYLNRILGSCDTQLELINDILQPTIKKLTLIHLNPWISNIVDNFLPTNPNISLTTQGTDFINDELTLTRIATELLNNSCKYSTQGSEIKVKADYDKEFNLLVSNHCHIPDRIVERMFQKDNGSNMVAGSHGRGLFGIKAAANRLGGDLSFDYSNNIASFKVQLPAN